MTTPDTAQADGKMAGKRRKLFKFVLFAVVTAAISSFAVMALWNWLMPTLFELPQVSFGQALGLLVLSRILFGGLFGRFGRRGWRHRRISGKDGPASP